MKKLFSLLLVLCMLGSGVCAAADTKATETPMVISTDNIVLVLMEKSQDLVKYKSDLSLARSTSKNLVEETDNM